MLCLHVTMHLVITVMIVSTLSSSTGRSKLVLALAEKFSDTVSVPNGLESVYHGFVWAELYDSALCGTG